MTPIETLGAPLSWLIWAILSGFVAHRLWRMAAQDSIFDRPREALLNRSPQWVVDLVDCPFCLGWWLAGVFPVVLFVDGSVSLTGAIVVWLVGSTVTGVIGRGD